MGRESRQVSQGAVEKELGLSSSPRASHLLYSDGCSFSYMGEDGIRRRAWGLAMLG